MKQWDDLDDAIIGQASILKLFRPIDCSSRNSPQSKTYFIASFNLLKVSGFSTSLRITFFSFITCNKIFYFFKIISNC